jgi:hypothetical protein
MGAPGSPDFFTLGANSPFHPRVKLPLSQFCTLGECWDFSPIREKRHITVFTYQGVLGLFGYG